MLNSKKLGFTLIELLIVLSIMATVSVFAIPSLLELHKDYESQYISNELKNFLIEGRQSSMIYRNDITLCMVDSANQCIKQNGKMFLIFKDQNNDQVFTMGTDTLYNKFEINPKYGTLKLDIGLRRSYIKIRADTGKPAGYAGGIKYCPKDGSTKHMFKTSISNVGMIKLKKNSEEATHCN